MTRLVIPGVVLAFALALALRCPESGLRPMHNDEAVNALKFRALYENGVWRYDPSEHHGPALAYFTLAWLKLTRAPDFAHLDEARLRMVTVLFGIGVLLLLLLLADGLGPGATVAAALLTAVSPAMVFYSRYYIHEMLLVFFTLLALAAGWRYARKPSLGWAIVIGVAVGLMQCAKETFVLSLAALAVAGIVVCLSGRRIAGAGAPPMGFKLPHLFAALGAWFAVAIVFFSSFFTNAAGPLDAFRTWAPWLQRAAGASPHVHPWYFYLARVGWFHVRGGPVWSEGLILALAAVGFVAAWRAPASPGSGAGLARFIAVYAAALAVIYSAVPYKTPWCLIEFWQPTILLAGFGAAALVRAMPGAPLKFAAIVLLVAAGGQLAWQAWRAAFTWCADPRNPYVYAQTSPDILNLVGRVEAVAASQPSGHHLLVKVFSPGSDYWPLPWYLRGFDQTGWWDHVPADPAAPVIIASTALNARLEGDGSRVMTGIFELRPDSFLELYVQTNVWKSFLATQPPPAGSDQ
jgi:uncharacterized protein (TIGR03663 family)